jgi:uncharacterized repeat protein (TIGR03803 family)
MTNLCGRKMLWAIVLLGVAAEIPASAQVFTTLANFSDSTGANSALIQGVDGNFYETQPNFPGRAFKITRGGELTTLYTFCAHSRCKDGYSPSGLVLATDGNFYGTTAYGGNQLCSGGCGTVFKLTPRGRLTTLYRFCSETYPVCTDGATPTAGLVQGKDGNFYGTTVFGGRGSCNFNQEGCGTVFKITADGRLSTLHSFFFEDGAHPQVALLQATDGNFYGATSDGGTSVGDNRFCARGCGTVFKMTQGGLLATLHSFCAQPGCADGADSPDLIQATDGTFYGTTSLGGLLNDACWQGCGTVYKITGPGILTTLHTFDEIDGSGPGTLVQATDRNFYGVTTGGGELSHGTLFTITPEGNLRTLHTFCPLERNGCPDGEYPSGLLQATDGSFYGSTEDGGASGAGTVFSLDMGLGPFVSFVNRWGKVGRTVGILGQGFTGTTGVSFNGTAANFVVQSDTYLTTKVPQGATAGFVTVTTPGGTLQSNVVFRVMP